MKPRGTLLMVAALFFFASDATGEVSDKIPPKALVLAWPLACLFVTAVAWSYRGAVGLLASLLVSLPTFALLSELADPFVGPAIRDEQGMLYVAAAIAAVGGIIIGTIYGIQSRRRIQIANLDHRKRRSGAAK